MRQVFVFSFLLFGFGVNAQTLIDSNLEQYSRQALIDGIKDYGDDVNEAGVVIMEVNSGNVITNVSIGHNKEKVKNIPYGNSESIPSGISRAVLYLSIMGTLDSNYVVETGNGIYTDSIMGCTITDMTYGRGGFGSLTLKKAFDLSDVGIIKAVEVAFNKNMARYSRAIRKTGIFFSDLSKIEDDSSSDCCQPWSPCGIMGYSSPYSLLQQAAWINMVANGGGLLLRFTENDSVTPICRVKDKAGLDSLAAAMLESVEYGTGKMMKSKNTRVAGLVNVSPPDALNCRACFAAAFWPYEAPQYTIAVFVNKHDLPAGRIIPSRIAGQIIEYMADKYLYLPQKGHDNIMPFRIYKDGEYHPADK